MEHVFWTKIWTYVDIIYFYNKQKVHIKFYFTIALIFEKRTLYIDKIKINILVILFFVNLFNKMKKYLYKS